ncbi:hypothetical protein D6779_06625 [Candidatus Parcubacteria bacterium]|nr:MAG: hypothetical protein D6779_06625 [Candidatus Parcubacteria bacterium]
MIDRRKLPLDQLRPLSSMADEDVPTYALFEPVGWTEQGEVVLQERRLIERDGTYFSDTLYQVINTVAVLPDTGAVKPLSDWSPPGPAVVHGFMDSVIKGPLWVIHGYNNEGITVLDWGSIPGWSSTQQKLAAKWAAKKPITYPQDWLAAPDGETVILQIRKEKIYILKPGYGQPIILPQNKEGVSAFVTAVTAQLSPDGQRIVYGVRFENPDSNDSYGRETDTYEIQTSSLNGNSITSIKLDYEYSYPREWAWSPNGEYIAFIAQPENHSPLHLYVAKSDGSSIIDLVSDDFWAAGPLYWSKDGGKLIYIGGNPDKQDSVGYWIISFLK